jgi:hypothetical protein
MAVFLSPVGGVAAQFFTNTGAVLTGGKLYTYAAGTTTPAVTFTSSGGSTFNSNPIVLDAAGRVPGSGEIWLSNGVQYKFVLKDSNDVLIATYDNINGINSDFTNFLANQEIQTATAGQTVFTLANAYTPGANTLSVFVDGVNQYGPGAAYAYYETNANTVTFVSGLHVGASVKFTTVQSLTSTQATTAALVSYTEGGTGAVTTNVQLKLRETVSVNDFGAGSTKTSAQNKTAIQAAINSGATRIFFPDATYSVDPGLEVNVNGLYLYGNSSIHGTALNFAPGAVPALWVGKSANVSGFTLTDIEFVGNSVTPGTQNTNGLVLGSVSPYYYVTGVEIVNCYIHNFLATGAAAILMNTCFWVNVRGNSTLNGCTYSVHIPAGGNVTATTFSENTKMRDSYIGFFNECTLSQVDQITFNNCSFEYNALTSIYSTSPQTKYAIIDCYFELDATTPGTNGIIFITSSDTSAYGFSTVNINGCQLHRVTSPPTLGYDINLGYCQRSSVQNLNGVNNFLQASNAEVYYFNNRGNGAGDPLADYKALLGTVNAVEYDPSSGYLVSYSSLGQITSDTHIYSQQKIAAPVATLVGSPANASIALATRSTDTAGQVTITTTGATSLSPIFKLTFNKAYIYAPIVIVTPASTDGGAKFVDNKMSVASTTTYFQLNTGSAVTASGLTMGFNYVVIGVVS